MERGLGRRPRPAAGPTRRRARAARSGQCGSAPARGRRMCAAAVLSARHRQSPLQRCLVLAAWSRAGPARPAAGWARGRRSPRCRGSVLLRSVIVGGVHGWTGHSSTRLDSIEPAQYFTTTVSGLEQRRSGGHLLVPLSGLRALRADQADVGVRRRGRLPELRRPRSPAVWRTGAAGVEPGSAGRVGERRAER